MILETFQSDNVITIADVGAINRGGDITAHPTCAAVINYTTLFTDYRTYLQITGL
jgi:hypothetical protein